MNTTAIILIILVIIYIPFWIMVRTNPKWKERGFEKYGPTIKINTHLGLRFIDRFGRYKRFWRAYGVFSQIVSFALMIMMIFIMVVAVLNLPNTLSSGGVGLEYVLAIPGLNPLLPFWFGLLALIIALVFHEMAHGLQSRANDVGVKHTGLLYGVVPLGAFVEPDEKDVEKASRRARLDIYTAGITTNFVIAAVAFLIFSCGMLGGISSPYEDNAAVYNEVTGSPAYDAGIPAGAIITEIGGVPFSYTSDYYDSPQYSWHIGDPVEVTYIMEDKVEHTATVVWGVYAEKTVDGSPAAGILDKSTIASVVYKGTTYYIYTAQAFSSFMSITHEGDVLTVNYVKLVDGAYTSQTADITLKGNNGIGYLGIYTTTAGMTLITPSALLSTAANPIYGADGITGIVSGMMSYIAHPFSGFDPVPENLQWWYGDQHAGFWDMCRILFWIFWLNILLGITNAIPALPFDGGLVLMGWVDKVYEKRGIADREERARRTNEVVRNISSLMIFLYLLIIISAIM